MAISRTKAYDQWTKRASTDLGKRARTHRLVRPATLGHVTGSGHWRAAAGRVDVSRELFRAPAGWSLQAKEGEGWIGHRYARLCVLEDPDGERLLFVTMDTLVGSRWLAEALGRRMAPHGIDIARVFVTCTHTHGALGATFGNLFYDTLAGGVLTRFDQIGAAWLEGRLGDEAERLVGVLEPVSLRRGEGVLEHGQIWQRATGSYLAQQGPPSTMSAAQITTLSQRAQPQGWEPATVPGGAVERASLRAVQPRVPIFAVHDAQGDLLYASGVIHGTGSLLVRKARLLSSDCTGAAARGLEHVLAQGAGREPIVALIAGAHGDANLSVVDQRVAKVLQARSAKRRSTETLGRVALRYIQRAADHLVQILAPAFQGVQPMAALGVEVRFAEAFAPGAAVASRAGELPAGVVPSPLNPRFLPTEWNFGGAVLGGSEFSKDNADTSTLFDLGTRRSVQWLSDFVDPVGWSTIATTAAFLGRPRATIYPSFLPLRLLRIGEVVFAGLPAEPSLRVLDAVASTFPGDHLHLAGNVGAYAGYADTVGAALMAEYEGASSYWGRDFGVYIVQQVQALASATKFHRATGAPDPDEWLLGGPMAQAAAVGGSAWFSLSHDRASKPVKQGPGKAQSGRVMGFVPDGTIPVTTPLPPGKALRVRGFWRPRRAAAERHGPANVSWPRVATDGPVAVVTLADGTVLRSDAYPMLLRWDGDLWQVSLEVDAVPTELTVEGVAAVRPHGAPTAPYTP